MAVTQQQQGERPEALSVSGAVALAKGALERVSVRLVGEVSELSIKPSYKAVYFTVKDRKAALPCLMWNDRYRAAGLDLRLGMLVELTGYFTLYEAKGRMNFNVVRLAPAGEGVLRMQIAQLARKLQAEGLMGQARKRALPAYPERIGLVTSPSGATVHDVLRTLRRRWPLARVLLAGVPVEGARAVDAMIAGMRCVAQAGAEVILLIRGGGSFEDHLPFNDERLARAIASMPVPVVTGIGHEPDNSIADMVADVRGSTPTYAADAVSPAQADLRRHLAALSGRLASAERTRIERARMRTMRLAMLPLFREPMRLFEGEAQKLDDLAGRLGQAIPRTLERDRAKLVVMHATLTRMLSRATERPAHRVDALRDRVRYRGETLTTRFKGEVSVAAAALQTLSPLGVLARGYAIARGPEGGVIASVDAVRPGDEVTIALSDGELQCAVEETRKIEMSLETWKDDNE